MKPVLQTRVGILGNCLSACIASLLDYESIPDWLDISAGVDPYWFNHLNLSLAVNAFTKYVQYNFDSPVFRKSPFIEMCCIAHFAHKKTERRSHAVVYDRVAQKIIHDPHPEGIVINSLNEWEPKYIGFLLPR
jgi:hypothetical protein